MDDAGGGSNPPAPNGEQPGHASPHQMPPAQVTSPGLPASVTPHQQHHTSPSRSAARDTPVEQSPSPTGITLHHGSSNMTDGTPLPSTPAQVTPPGRPASVAPHQQPQDSSAGHVAQNTPIQQPLLSTGATSIQQSSSPGGLIPGSIDMTTSQGNPRPTSREGSSDGLFVPPTYGFTPPPRQISVPAADSSSSHVRPRGRYATPYPTSVQRQSNADVSDQSNDMIAEIGTTSSAHPSFLPGYRSSQVPASRVPASRTLERQILDAEAPRMKMEAQDDGLEESNGPHISKELQVLLEIREFALRVKTFEARQMLDTESAKYLRGFEQRCADGLISTEEEQIARRYIQPLDKRPINIAVGEEYRQTQARTHLEKDTQDEPQVTRNRAQVANKRRKLNRMRPDFSSKYRPAHDILGEREEDEGAWNTAILDHPASTTGSVEEEPRSRASRRGRTQMPDLITSNSGLLGEVLDSPMADGDNAPVFRNLKNMEVLSQIITAGTEDNPAKPRKSMDTQQRLRKGMANLKSTNTLIVLANEPHYKYKLHRMSCGLSAAQLQAVQWMRWREQSSVPPYGGILADRPGFGKTVMALACAIDGQFLAKFSKMSGRGTLIICDRNLIPQWQNELMSKCELKGRGNPIGRGKHTEYVGNTFGKHDRERTPRELLDEYDYVFTTFEEVVSSWPMSKCPPDVKRSKKARERWWKENEERSKGLLHKICWHRIIVDECQKIKNKNSQRFEAVFSLKAHYRWLLSGTPIVDQLKEIYTYLKFLGLPYTGNWSSFAKNHLKDENATNRLNFRLNNLILRRTNLDTIDGMPVAPLAPAKMTKINCPMSRFELEFYRSICDATRARMSASLPAGKTTRGLVLPMITNLQKATTGFVLNQRQFAEFSDAMQKRLIDIYNEEREYDYEERIRKLQETCGLPTECGVGGQYGRMPLLDKYLEALEHVEATQESDDGERCASCGVNQIRHVLKPCLHELCQACYDEHSIGGPSLERHCPIMECDQVIHFSSLVEEEDTLDPSRGAPRSKAPSKKFSWPTLKDVFPMPSTKCLIVKLKILQWLYEDPTTKIIVFTQHLGICENLRRMCQYEKWNARVYNGAVGDQAKEKALRDFLNLPEVNVLIATTKTGGTGLNLTVATKVIIMEPWWNLQLDDQAFARVWRIGQTKPTECVRLYIKGTVDTHKVEIRDKKMARISKLKLKGESVANMQQLVEWFKPGETAAELKRGAFLVVDDTRIPENMLRRDDSEMEDDDTGLVIEDDFDRAEREGQEVDYDEYLNAPADGVDEEGEDDEEL